MEYLSVAEYAQQAGLSVPTVYRKLDKELRKYAKKVDGKWKISSHALITHDKEEAPIPEEQPKTGTSQALIDEKDLIIADLKARLEGKEETILSLRELVEVQKNQIQAQQTQLEDLAGALTQAQQIASTSKAQLAVISTEKIPWWDKLFKRK